MRFLGHDRKTIVYAALVLIVAFSSIWAQAGAGGAAGRLGAKAVTKGADAVYPESDHPYANDFDFTWSWQSGSAATYLDVTFDPQTLLAEGDLLYILDSHGTNIPGSPFTGASLAGATRRVPGANVQIRLLTNAAGAAWGFKITNIELLDIPAPDLMISKSHEGTFAVGQVGATYSIFVRNIGTAPTTGPVTVTDLLPPGLVASSIGGEGWNCIQPGGPCQQTQILNNRGSYPPLRITVTVAPQPSGTVINRAIVSGGGDSNTGNNTAEDPTDIESKGPDLHITKSHPGNFIQGQTGATYTLLISNLGQGPTSGPVTVTETAPAGLTVTSMAGTGWNCTQPAGPCERQDVLLNGSTFPGITVTVDVAVNAPNLVTNVAKVSTLGDVNSNNDTANDLTSILINGPDLGILKSHTGNFKQNQTGATYTLEVRNTGTQPTSGLVTVAETIPVGLIATSMNGPGWTCAQPAGPCTRSDVLAPNASYPAITLTVNVANNAYHLTNTASVSGGNDANLSNNIVTDPTIIEGDPTCTQFPESPHPYPNNFDFTWTCVVVNPPNTTVHVTFDALTSVQNGADFIHISDGAGNPIPGSPFTGTSLAGQTKIVPGNTVKIRLVSNASVQDWGLKVTNIVGMPGGNADLTIAKTHSGSFYRGHIGAQYTIIVQNVGTAPATGLVTVTDTLPAGMTATSIGGTGWNCAQPGGPCTRSDVLAQAASYPAITLTVNVASNALAALTNIASVTGGGDVTPNNNTASDVTQILTPVATCNPVPESTHPYDNDLNQLFTCVLPGNPAAIDVSFDPQTLFQEGDLLYIRDKNNNNIPGSPFSGASLAGATKTVPGDTVRLNLVTDSRRNEWGFKVTNIVGAGSVNPDLTIAKTHNGNFTQGQNGATYQIVVRNIGGGATIGQVTVTDNVPAGLVATAIGGTGWNCVQPAGPCTRNDALASGGAYPPLTLTVNVQGNAAALVTNIATVAGGGDGNPGNNNAADPTTVTPVGGGGGGGGGCVLPESTHPYANDLDFTWTCTIAGNPASIKVTFDPQTAIDPTDQLYVMSGSGVNIAGSPFTGVALAGQTVTVPGDTVKIRLVTDGRRTDWGFKVTSVVP